MRQRDGERRMEMEVEMGVRNRCRWERDRDGNGESTFRVPGGDSGDIQRLLEENLMKGPFTEIWVGLEGANKGQQSIQGGAAVRSTPLFPASEKPR